MGAQTLPVSRLVQVAVSLAPAAAAGRNFGNSLIVGDSDVITGLERIEDFSGLTEVAQRFGTNAAETKAATVYFGQSPTPASVSVGRWLRTATAGLLQGSILSAAQSALSLFNQITTGGFSVTIDGVVKNLTAMDFSTALNLNGVASIVTAALSGAGTCIWTGSQFEVESSTTGAGHKATGYIRFSGQPGDGDTVTINGIVLTFRNAPSLPNEVLIGGTDAQTAVNLWAFLTNSTSPNLLLMTYTLNTLDVDITAVSVGVAGNSLTLVESASNVAVSSATLLGGTNPSSVSYATAPGSGQDVSTLMGLTAALALPLVPGYDAETALEAITALDAASTGWYGVGFGSSVIPSDDDMVAVGEYLEADPVTRLLAATIQDSNCLSSEVTTDLGSRLMAEGLLQVFTQYSSSNPYAALSILGRIGTVDFEGENTTITLMYKQEPGITAENLDDTEADVLEAKRINVFVAYDNGTQLIQYGTCAGPAYIDEIFGIDWLQNAIQTAEFNVNYTSTTKVPQTDQGTTQFVNAANDVLGQGATNGLIAPGVWNGPAFGSLLTGQFLKTGYYTYAPSVASQSQSDVAARKSPLIQSAFKFAGANHIVDVLVTASR